MATADKAPAKVKRDRSPAYPFISLKVAIDRLVSFDKTFGRHPAPLDKAGLAWALKGESSQAAQTLSALKYFGLLEYTGTTEDRVAAMTEGARNYLRAQQASVKAELLKSFALRPRAIQTYWAKWNADRPIDEVCLDELMLKDGFTDSAAKTFLRVYDDTIAFSGLGSSDKKVTTAEEEEDEEEEEEEEDEQKLPSIQTNVTPATAQPFSKPPIAPQISPLSSVPTPVGMKQDTFTLDEGPVILQWPASMSATSYEDFNDWIELQLRKIKRSIPQ